MNPDIDRPRSKFDPSWGPIGSLLYKRDPEGYARVLAQDEEMIARERAKQPAPPERRRKDAA